MPQPLKYMYHPGFFETFCPVLCDILPGFDCREFIFRIFNNSWPDLELKARVRRISTVLHSFMPVDFPDAAVLLVKIADRLQDVDPERSFEYIFLPDYVEVFGTDFPDESLVALTQITKLVSAEFAVRPFIRRYPEKTFSHMLAWSAHPDPRVRRLASMAKNPKRPKDTNKAG